jgi:hypothetical protein
VRLSDSFWTDSGIDFAPCTLVAYDTTISGAQNTRRLVYILGPKSIAPSHARRLNYEASAIKADWLDYAPFQFDNWFVELTRLTYIDVPRLTHPVVGGAHVLMNKRCRLTAAFIV